MIFYYLLEPDMILLNFDVDRIVYPYLALKINWNYHVNIVIQIKIDHPNKGKHPLIDKYTGLLLFCDNIYQSYKIKSEC